MWVTLQTLLATSVKHGCRFRSVLPVSRELAAVTVATVTLSVAPTVISVGSIGFATMPMMSKQCVKNGYRSVIMTPVLCKTSVNHVAELNVRTVRRSIAVSTAPISLLDHVKSTCASDVGTTSVVK